MGDLGERRPVLLGYDASPAGTQALRWAVDEAVTRELPLVVCHAWQWPYPLREQDARAMAIVRAMGGIVVADGVAKARDLTEGLRIRPLLVRGTAPAALLEASRAAEMVVIGARGSGGFEGLRLGSAATQVPGHCARPVVVVPAVPSAPRHDAVRIVVGVDGSPASEAALEFAISEAEPRGHAVTAVCGWWDPWTVPGPEQAPFIDLEALKREVKSRFERAVASARARRPRVAVETRFVLSRPQRVLTDLAEGASLLVVGDRGLGTAPEALLGTVTRNVLHEAPCPIAVVHSGSSRKEST